MFEQTEAAQALEKLSEHVQRQRCAEALLDAETESIRIARGGKAAKDERLDLAKAKEASGRGGFEHHRTVVARGVAGDEVRTKLGEQHKPRDLVVNNGTSEHLFNQHAVFENAHRLSRRAIVHLLPFTPWINHGFCNDNPILFRDLAAANSYLIRAHWIGNRWGAYVDFTGDSALYVEKNPQFMGRLKEVPRG